MSSICRPVQRVRGCSAGGVSPYAAGSIEVWEVLQLPPGYGPRCWPSRCTSCIAIPGFSSGVWAPVPPALSSRRRCWLSCRKECATRPRRLNSAQMCSNVLEKRPECTPMCS